METRASLKTVGWALIAFGLVDACVMVACLVNGTGYASSFNIFAVIAGLFLLRGSLKAAHVIALFSAIYFSLFLGAGLVLPAIYPARLIRTFTILHPLYTSAIVLLYVGLLVFLFWVNRTLVKPRIRTAIAELPEGGWMWRAWRRSPPYTGFLIGGFMILVLLIVIPMALTGEDAVSARERAVSQYGIDYDYVVNSINVTHTQGRKHVQANVVAFNGKEIRNVAVGWEE